jgi:geranylgeranyl pyrophosphate synthase
LEEAVRTISAIGIDQHVRHAAKAHIDKAIKSIENYKTSDAKKALESSANFIVERSM